MLHGFAWRSSKNMVLRPKTLKFDKKVQKYFNNPKNYLKIQGFQGTPCEAPCGAPVFWALDRASLWGPLDHSCTLGLQKPVQACCSSSCCKYVQSRQCSRAVHRNPEDSKGIFWIWMVFFGLSCMSPDSPSTLFMVTIRGLWALKGLFAVPWGKLDHFSKKTWALPEPPCTRAYVLRL